MTLRRYAQMKKSAGTVIPTAVRQAVRDRDQGCVGPRVGMPGDCFGGLELDHVKTGGMGRKSPSTVDGLATLCSIHHRWKTEHGREARPALLRYLEG